MPIELWLLAIFSSFTIGLTKGGIKGIDVIIVLSMALAFGSKVSTGIVLPLLMIGDVLAVIYYRRHAQWNYVFKLLPWILLGVVIASFVGNHLDEATFKLGMSTIVLISVVLLFWWESRKSDYIPDRWWFATPMGITVGFTTMIGNLAGTFSNIYFLAMRLPKEKFIGTVSWLFFIVNIFKLPFHIWVWHTVTIESLKVDLKLVPFTLFGFFIGIRLVKLISNDRFRIVVLAFTAIGAAILVLK